MKTVDFINQAIGSLVYITNKLYIYGELRPLINNKTPLRLIRWTKGGSVYLQDEKTSRFYTVPPKAIREI